MLLSEVKEQDLATDELKQAIRQAFNVYGKRKVSVSPIIIASQNEDEVLIYSYESEEIALRTSVIYSESVKLLESDEMEGLKFIINTILDLLVNPSDPVLYHFLERLYAESNSYHVIESALLALGAYAISENANAAIVGIYKKLKSKAKMLADLAA
jgi:hypothetical protein